MTFHLQESLQESFTPRQFYVHTAVTNITSGLRYAQCTRAVDSKRFWEQAVRAQVVFTGGTALWHAPAKWENI